MAFQIQPGLFSFCRRHKLIHLAPLKTRSRHQAITQCARRFGKVARHHEGVGLIQNLRAAMAGSGLAQHPPKQLLHRRRGMQGRHAHQNVGKWTVPALGQRLLGDDKLYWTSRIGNAQLVISINLFQPLFLAGRHHDFAGRNAVVGD